MATTNNAAARPPEPIQLLQLFLNGSLVPPGNHELKLKHWRDWQGDGSVIDRFRITVRVH